MGRDIFMQFENLILFAIETLRPYAKFYLIATPIIMLVSAIIVLIDIKYGKLSEGSLNP